MYNYQLYKNFIEAVEDCNLRVSDDGSRAEHLRVLINDEVDKKFVLVLWTPFAILRQTEFGYDEFSRGHHYTQTLQMFSSFNRILPREFYLDFATRNPAYQGEQYFFPNKQNNVSKADIINALKLAVDDIKFHQHLMMLMLKSPI